MIEIGSPMKSCSGHVAAPPVCAAAGAVQGKNAHFHAHAPAQTALR